MKSLQTLSNRELYAAPSLLAADFGCLKEEVRRIAAAGADVLHLDVMDGAFVPNISFGVPVIASLRPESELLFDTHLMIEHPARYAEAFARAGSDHLTFHLESADDPEEVIAAVRRTGCSAGISIRPGTPAEELFPYLDRIDLVLVMTVEPGFGGQKFMPEMMPKVRLLREEITRRGLNTHVEIDGGIGAETVKPCIASGGNMFVAGTSVFKAADAAAAVAALKRRD